MATSSAVRAPCTGNDLAGRRLGHRTPRRCDRLRHLDEDEDPAQYEVAFARTEGSFGSRSLAQPSPDGIRPLTDALAAAAVTPVVPGTVSA
ncbi:MAG TPA: hypothetical protein VFP72_13040 [Kineosporiaceae bacterium]|nr:hypothetical protein [Kineosporiaceae bacterium]